MKTILAAVTVTLTSTIFWVLTSKGHVIQDHTIDKNKNKDYKDDIVNLDLENDNHLFMERQKEYDFSYDLMIFCNSIIESSGHHDHSTSSTLINSSDDYGSGKNEETHNIDGDDELVKNSNGKEQGIEIGGCVITTTKITKSPRNDQEILVSQHNYRIFDHGVSVPHLDFKQVPKYRHMFQNGKIMAETSRGDTLISLALMEHLEKNHGHGIPPSCLSCCHDVSVNDGESNSNNAEDFKQHPADNSSTSNLDSNLWINSASQRSKRYLTKIALGLYCLLNTILFRTQLSIQK